MTPRTRLDGKFKKRLLQKLKTIELAGEPSARAHRKRVAYRGSAAADTTLSECIQTLNRPDKTLSEALSSSEAKACHFLVGDAVSSSKPVTGYDYDQACAQVKLADGKTDSGWVAISMRKDGFALCAPPVARGKDLRDKSERVVRYALINQRRYSEELKSETARDLAEAVATGEKGRARILLAKLRAKLPSWRTTLIVLVTAVTLFLIAAYAAQRAKDVMTLQEYLSLKEQLAQKQLGLTKALRRAQLSPEEIRDPAKAYALLMKSASDVEGPFGDTQRMRAEATKAILEYQEAANDLSGKIGIFENALKGITQTLSAVKTSTGDYLETAAGDVGAKATGAVRLAQVNELAKKIREQERWLQAFQTKVPEQELAATHFTRMFGDTLRRDAYVADVAKADSVRQSIRDLKKDQSELFSSVKTLMEQSTIRFEAPMWLTKLVHDTQTWLDATRDGFIGDKPSVVAKLQDMIGHAGTSAGDFWTRNFLVTPTAVADGLKGYLRSGGGWIRAFFEKGAAAGQAASEAGG